MILRSLLTITPFIGCIAFLGFTRVGEHATISFIFFLLSHLFLYFLVFHTFKNKFKKWQSTFVFVLLSSLCFRLLFLSYPISDDVHRYAWEGKNIWVGYNPYSSPPLDFHEAILKNELSNGEYQKAISFCQKFELDEIKHKKNLSRKLNVIIKQEGLILKLPNSEHLQKNQNVSNALIAIQKENIKFGMPKLKEMNRLLIEESLPFLKDKIYRGINHKEIKTVYPPLGILFFAGISKVHYSLFSFKVFFIVIDLACIFCLLLLVRKHEKPFEWVLLYAWSPLVLMYGVGESHLDILLTFFLTLSLLLFSSKRVFYKIALGFFFLGCAVMTKYLALIALPFFVTKKNLLASCFFILPFFAFTFFITEGFFEGLIIFSSEMHYNDSIAKILRWLFDSKLEYQLSMLGCYSIGFFFFWFFHQDNKLRGIQLSWMWLLLCLPVLHPWYIIPVVAMSCLYPSRSWFLISIMMGLQFYVLEYQLNNEGGWKEFNWISLCTYGLFVFSLLYGHFRKNWFEVKEYDKPESLDVVMPVFNEEMKIKNTLNTLLEECEKVKEASEGFEVAIYIVDGGSTDMTMKILKEMDLKESVAVHVNTSVNRGRGNQLYDGFKKGHGELVLFLHADSQLNTGALVKMVNSFKSDNLLAWGVLGHKYDVKLVRLKFIECLNYIRMNWMGIGFGDQGMFFRRCVLDEIKVPKFPLMEDLEISLRLYKFRTRINLINGLEGSARRWEKRNFPKSVVMVIYLCIKFMSLRLFGVNVQKMAEKMYEEYYG